VFIFIFTTLDFYHLDAIFMDFPSVGLE